jgi:hypothetical protein
MTKHQGHTGRKDKESPEINQGRPPTMHTHLCMKAAGH